MSIRQVRIKLKTMRKAYNMRDSTREVAATFVASVREGNAIMVFSNAVAYFGSW